MQQLLSVLNARSAMIMSGRCHSERIVLPLGGNKKGQIHMYLREHHTIRSLRMRILHLITPLRQIM
jgi:hypothetical protein